MPRLKHKGRLVRDYYENIQNLQIYEPHNRYELYRANVQTLKHTRRAITCKNYCGCEKFWEAIQNYGTDCWSVEILWDGLTLDEANIYEQIEIKDNETLYPYGYNVSLGGFNATHSPDTRAKISKNNGRYFKDKKIY